MDLLDGYEKIQTLRTIYLFLFTLGTKLMTSIKFELSRLCLYPCFVLFCFLFVLMLMSYDFVLFCSRHRWCWLWCMERLVVLRSLSMLELMYAMFFIYFHVESFGLVIILFFGFSAWAFNYTDIDVWFYTSKNLLALCCLLWSCRLP